MSFEGLYLVGYMLRCFWHTIPLVKQGLVFKTN